MLRLLRTETAINVPSLFLGMLIRAREIHPHLSYFTGLHSVFCCLVKSDSQSMLSRRTGEPRTRHLALSKLVKKLSYGASRTRDLVVTWSRVMCVGSMRQLHREHDAAADLNPQPTTLNPQHSTLNPQPSTLNPQHSTLGFLLLVLHIARNTSHRNRELAQGSGFRVQGLGNLCEEYSCNIVTHVGYQNRMSSAETRVRVRDSDFGFRV